VGHDDNYDLRNMGLDRAATWVDRDLKYAMARWHACNGRLGMALSLDPLPRNLSLDQLGLRVYRLRLLAVARNHFVARRSGLLPG